MKKILIINPFGIGDVLFTTPAVAAIKENLAGAVVGYWCNERVRPILGDNPAIDKIFALARGDIKKIFKESYLAGISKSLGLFLRIKKERFDIALDFSLDHRYGLVAGACGIKRRIGFNYKKRGRFLTEKIDIDGYAGKHIVEYYLDLLKIIGIIPKNRKLQLRVNQGDNERVRDILRRAGLNTAGLIVGICPGAGASWGKDASFKRWPAVKFAGLADKIIRNCGAQILILGDDSEASVAQAMIESMQEKAVNFCGRTSLGELIAIINNLEILVTNDGGPLHIAAALGRKTLSFFGPADPAVYGPYPPDTSRHIILRKDLPCSPCYRGFRLRECKNNKECLKGITVDIVFEAVNELLIDTRP